jgi:hypothetical protein
MRNEMLWLRAHYQIGLYEDMKIIPDRMLGAASARSTPIRFWKLRRTALPPARARGMGRTHLTVSEQAVLQVRALSRTDSNFLL